MIDKMLEEIKLTIPTGYLRVMIEVDENIPYTFLESIDSWIAVYDTHDKRVFYKRSIQVGRTFIVTLSPGEYVVHTRLGGVTSEKSNIKINLGEIQNLVFHFGKSS